LLVLRGLGMGSADIIPGVSGGTVALITGIYDRLVEALRGIDFLFIVYFFRGFV
jgi:putative membrane protein